MFKRPFSAAAAILALVAVTSTPAWASGGRVEEATRPYAESCESQAQSLDAIWWLCLGDSLQYAVESSQRGAVDVRETRVPGGPYTDAPTMSVMATRAEPSNYDTYCEYSGTCTGFRNDYISWIKGNALYGNSDGAVGSFDVILKINLNGRQPRYTTMFYHDSGPGLKFTGTTVSCRENNPGPDSNCGSWGAFNGSSSHNLGKGTFTSKLIYGNKLNDSNDYFSTISGYFTPTGYPRYTMAALRSAPFNCFGKDPCYFPGA